MLGSQPQAMARARTAAEPAVPLPATVVMVPAGSTFRIRWFHVSAMYTFPDESVATP